MLPRAELVIVQGKDQDSYWGSLDADQEFVGEKTEVNVWHYVLLPEQMGHLHKEKLPSPRLDRTALSYQLQPRV